MALGLYPEELAAADVVTRSLLVVTEEDSFLMLSILCAKRVCAVCPLLMFKAA
nr:hypothetical protein [Legionella jordanis]